MCAAQVVIKPDILDKIINNRQGLLWWLELGSIIRSLFLILSSVAERTLKDLDEKYRMDILMFQYKGATKYKVVGR